MTTPTPLVTLWEEGFNGERFYSGVTALFWVVFIMNLLCGTAALSEGPAPSWWVYLIFPAPLVGFGFGLWQCRKFSAKMMEAERLGKIEGEKKAELVREHLRDLKALVGLGNGDGFVKALERFHTLYQETLKADTTTHRDIRRYYGSWESPPSVALAMYHALRERNLGLKPVDLDALFAGSPDAQKKMEEWVRARYSDVWFNPCPLWHIASAEDLETWFRRRHL